MTKTIDILIDRLGTIPMEVEPVPGVPGLVLLQADPRWIQAIKWRVTHEASGRCILAFNRKKEALQAARLLKEVADWALPAAELRHTHGWRDAFQVLVQVEPKPEGASDEDWFLAHQPRGDVPMPA